MKMLYLDGPMSGKVCEFRNDACGMESLTRKPDADDLELQWNDDDEPATSATEAFFNRVEYRRHTLQNTMLSNEVCRIYTSANVAVCEELPELPINESVLLPVMEANIDWRPRFNILDDFESWFNQTVYQMGIPCDQTRTIQEEIDTVIGELQSMQHRLNRITSHSTNSEA